MCTPPDAQPHPKVLWLINDQPAPIEYTSIINVTSIQLRFPLQVYHLHSRYSKFSIRCVASFSFNQSLFQTTSSIETSALSSDSSVKLNIYGLQSKYILGQILSLTCYYTGTDAVKMYWRVNYVELPSNYIVTYASGHFIGINMTIEPWHLDHRNQIRVKCVASNIFKLIPTCSASIISTHYLLKIFLCKLILFYFTALV